MWLKYTTTKLTIKSGVREILTSVTDVVRPRNHVRAARADHSCPIRDKGRSALRGTYSIERGRVKVRVRPLKHHQHNANPRQRLEDAHAMKMIVLLHAMVPVNAVAHAAGGAGSGSSSVV